MIKQYFDQLATGIESSLVEKPIEASAKKRYALEVAKLGQRLYSGENTVAWCGVLAPFDLLHALGVTSCFVEFIGAMLASMDGASQAIKISESNGYSTDTCSYHRAIIGAAGMGLMPVPDFLIASSNPCSGGLATIENLARIFKRDMFIIHVPHDSTPEGVEFLSGELREMVAFVEAHTGRKLDRQDLVKSIENSNRLRSLMIEIFNLAKSIPTPARRSDLINFAFVMMLIAGTDDSVRLAEYYRDEFKKKVETGQGGVSGEKIRLLWIQNRIQFKNPLEKMLEEEFHAAVVVDELNDINWGPVDPDNVYRTIAERTLCNPLTGPIGGRIDHIVKLVREYKVDGVLHPCQWGCRQGTGPRGLIQEGLRKEGIPVLNLELDCIDRRNFSAGPLKTRLEAFIEMLTERKYG